jgi:hypothetical protein
MSVHLSFTNVHYVKTPISQSLKSAWSLCSHIIQQLDLHSLTFSTFTFKLPSIHMR